MLAIQRFSAISSVDWALRLYRHNFRILLSISLIMSIPGLLMSLLLTFWEHEVIVPALEKTLATQDLTPLFTALDSFGWGHFLLILLSYVFTVVAGMLGLAAATQVTSDVAVGVAPTIGKAVRKAFSSFWSLLGATILSTLLFIVVLLFSVAPGVALFFLFWPLGLGLVSLGILITSIVFLGFLAFVGPVVVLEDRRAAESLNRAWRLTGRRRLKIFSAVVLLTVILIVTAFGLITGAATFSAFYPNLWGRFLLALLSQVLGALVSPAFYVTLILLYFDARVEHDAFDVDYLVH